MNSPTENASSRADELIQANRAAAKQRLQRIVIIGSAIAAIALILGGISMFTSSTAPPVSTPQDVVERVDNSDELRQTFLDAFAEFEDIHKPLLASEHVIAFNSKQVAALLAEEKSALTAFSQSAFQTAIEKMSALIAATKALKLEWQKAHATALELANSEYSNGNINRARLAFKQAQKLNPQHPENRVVQQRLDSFERIKELKDALAVARVENHLSKQQSILAELLTLPDQLREYQADYDAISAELDERRLSDLLLQANTALSQQNTREALGLLKQAKLIDPKAAAIALMEQSLNQLREKQNKAAWLAALEDSANNDDWQQLVIDAQTAISQFPNDGQFVSYKDTAINMLQMQKRLGLFLRQPNRLSDQGLRLEATKTLKNAMALSLSSPSIAEQVKQLASHLQDYQQAQTVTIESDGVSDVQIVGVGQVGTTTAKSITLTPGLYTAEAKREGYKTVRKQFTVNKGQVHTVFIATEEKI